MTIGTTNVGNPGRAASRTTTPHANPGLVPISDPHPTKGHSDHLHSRSLAFALINEAAS